MKSLDSMTKQELIEAVRALREQVKALKQKLDCIALAAAPGKTVLQIWQVAAHGCDTALGDGYYAVDKDPDATDATMRQAGFEPLVDRSADP